jgi:hypothetical protein
MMTLLETTIEEEFRRHNAAINTVTAYCHFQEGGYYPTTCKAIYAKGESDAVEGD